MKGRGLFVLQLVLAGIVPFMIGLAVHRQGFNLLDDGLWLLGTRIVTEGGSLYGDIFSIYGPARYYLLAPFFLVLGKSALTLAVFKAVLDGIAAGFGWWYTRRLGAGRWAWLVPVGVVAFGPVHPRYVAAALFAALVGRLMTGGPSRRMGRYVGLAWGGLCLFGLDMAGYGAVILLGGWFLARRVTSVKNPPARLVPGELVSGLALVLGAAVLVGAIAGVLPVAFWDTVVYPVTRFGDAMGVSWFASFRADPLLHHPFSGQFTGESLSAAWIGHAWQRAAGLRLMFLLVWLIPVAFLWAARRRPDPRLGPLAALALAGWVTLLGRGDVLHLRLVWYATLLLVPVLVARLPRDGWVGAAVGGLFILLVAAVPFGEKIWLATHLDRPGLVRWERETAKVYLDAERLETLETVCDGLPWDGSSPVLVWPAQPGIQFVIEAPLATPQVTLLGGEVRSVPAVLEQLKATAPTAAVLGTARGLVAGASEIRGLEPELWSWLRRNFLLEEEVSNEGESFLLAVPAALKSGPVAKGADSRLPGIAQQITTGTTAAVGTGMTVAQTFEVEDLDLGAVEVAFRCPGPYPYPISLLVTLFDVSGRRGGGQLLQFPFRVALTERTQKIRFSFPVLAGTTGKTVLMEIAGHPEGTQPFSLLWNAPSAEVPEFVDYYPEGQAYVEKQPVTADLYFVTY